MGLRSSTPLRWRRRAAPGGFAEPRLSSSQALPRHCVVREVMQRPEGPVRRPATGVRPEPRHEHRVHRGSGRVHVLHEGQGIGNVGDPRNYVLAESAVIEIRCYDRTQAVGPRLELEAVGMEADPPDGVRRCHGRDVYRRAERQRIDPEDVGTDDEPSTGWSDHLTDGVVRDRRALDEAGSGRLDSARQQAGDSRTNADRGWVAAARGHYDERDQPRPDKDAMRGHVSSYHETAY